MHWLEVASFFCKLTIKKNEVAAKKQQKQQLKNKQNKNKPKR